MARARDRSLVLASGFGVFHLRDVDCSIVSLIDKSFEQIPRIRTLYLCCERIRVMQIRFASLLPWWVVIAIAVIGGVAICLWYWREVRQIRSRWSVLLAVLRGTAFFLLFVMLLRPSIEYTWTQGDLSRLRILMDTSSSMQTRDEPSLQNPNESVSRIERVKQSLVHETNGQPSLLARLARQHHIDVVNLEGQVIWDSQQTTMLDSNWEIAADRARTPLGEALWLRFARA